MLQANYTIFAGAGVGDVDGAQGDPPTTGTIDAWDFSGADTEAALPRPLFRHTADNRAWIDSESIFPMGSNPAIPAGGLPPYLDLAWGPRSP